MAPTVGCIYDLSTGDLAKLCEKFWIAATG